MITWGLVVGGQLVKSETTIVDAEIELAKSAGLTELASPNRDMKSGTASGSSASPQYQNSPLHHLKEAASTATLKRQARAQLLLCSFSAIWLTSMVAFNYASSAMAWSIALTGLMLVSLVRLLHINQEIKFRLDGQRLTGSTDQSDIDLSELAGIILTVSSAVLAIIALLIQFKYIEVHEAPIKRQVVEIELVSPLDAVKNNELLPSTSIATTTAQRSADLITVLSENLLGRAKVQVEKIKLKPVKDQGKEFAKETLKKSPKRSVAKKVKIALNEVASIKILSEPSPEQPSLIKVPPQKIPITFKAPSTWKTVVVAPDKDKSLDFATYSAAGSASAPPYTSASSKQLQSNEAVEMVESIDNEGSKKVLRSQSGGRSNGGAGAASDLHAYLKLLNKKVKYFWIPPSGLDRIAVIQFRIKANGTLLGTKALSHDGEIDPEAEAAAISAITKVFPFYPLPKDVKAGYLDVRYTFNYRFKQIDGVRNPD